MSTFEPSLPRPKPKKSWFGRNWWWVLLLILIGGGVVCAGICTGTVLLGVKTLKQTEPYQLTLNAVRTDPIVIERLGEPIEDSWQVTVQMNATNNQGNALMTIPISGPKGAANVRSEAQLINGKWGLTAVEITFADGERHALVITSDQAGAGANQAAPWMPPGEVGGPMPQMPPAPPTR